MTILLLSGRGPEIKNRSYFDGSMLDPRWDTQPAHTRPLGQLSLSLLHYRDPYGQWQPLLRPKAGTIPFLVTYVLESILYANEEPYESYHLDHLWDSDAEPFTTDPEAVLLSTTFICNRNALARVVSWIQQRYPAVPLILGGQYSNLKFAKIFRDYPEVSYIARGDGEAAIPALLRTIRTGASPSTVPNLAWRDSNGGLRVNPISYIDLETYPAPAFPGTNPVLPYESMRGCPFSCKFCSYPHASPQWRHKSATKIYNDWTGYVEQNGVRHIQALDSTFTVPRPRLNELLPMLHNAPFTWEAYTRANAIHSPEIVAAMERAHCHKLSIGFESMSPNTLAYMHKQVRPPQNRRAHDLLADSEIRYRVSFMVGYPGETPDDYAVTRQYLLDEYTGHFMLSVFSFTDETMPVWQDAERFALSISDPDDPDYNWSHAGMDVIGARALHQHTLDSARWGSEDAVLLLWQAGFQTPLVPGVDRRTALRLEKLVERLAMLPTDFRYQPDQQRQRAASLLSELVRHGIKPVSGTATPWTSTNSSTRHSKG